MARLAGLEGLTRAVMVGTVPLAALDALGSKTAVSVAFLLGSTSGVVVTLYIGRIEQIVARRWVLSGGIAAVFAAAGLFAYGPAWGIPVAIGLRAAHASVFSVCLSLYIMDFIGKGDLTRVESRRSVYLAAGWLVGPVVGTWLSTDVRADLPFLLAMGLAVASAGYHWWLRLEGHPVLLVPTTPVVGPMRAIPRFFEQRSLRVSYAITCSRAIFWASLFIYGPIYVVESGLPGWAAGAFLSVASAVLFIGPLVRHVADRSGVRTVIMAAFVLMAASLLALAVIGPARPVGVLFWLTGAVGGGVIDVLGNIPFMRLVRPRERTAMVTVFSTWREVSFVVAPGLAALILVSGSFRFFYLTLAVLMGFGAWATSFLPRRL